MTPALQLQHDAKALARPAIFEKSRKIAKQQKQRKNAKLRPKSANDKNPRRRAPNPKRRKTEKTKNEILLNDRWNLISKWENLLDNDMVKSAQRILDKMNVVEYNMGSLFPSRLNHITFDMIEEMKK